MRVPQICDAQPKQLKALRNRIIGSNVVSTLLKQNNSSHKSRDMRDISELLQALKQGNTHDISHLEWSLLLRYVHQWHGHVFVNVVLSCKHNTILSNKLLSLFVKLGADPTNDFCKQCLQQRQNLINTSEQWGITIGLWANDKGFASQLIRDFSRSNKTLSKDKSLVSKGAWMWKRIGKQNLVDALIKHDAFVKRDMSKEQKNYMVRWFIRCLDEIYNLDPEYTTSVVKTLANSLVTKGRVQQVKVRELQALSSWLKRHVSMSADKALWESLSSKQREVLTMIMGEMTYNTFKNLIKQLAKNTAKTEANQLQRRVEFWGKYTKDILEIYIFASESSYDSLKEEKVLVKKLLTDENMVVCVMETQKWLIVEFLSGWSAEVRVLPYSFRDIFTKDVLDIDVVRRINAKLVHDHRSYWQWSLSAMLKDILDIKGIGSRSILDSKQIADRKNDLERWRKTAIISDIEYNKVVACLTRLKKV